MIGIVPKEVSWSRMEFGLEQVRHRLLRTAQALDGAGVPYAVVGGNAVAAWVSRVDTAAVRNTRDVDILLERRDQERATKALENAGFVHRRLSSRGKGGAIDVFLDHAEAKVLDAVHVLWAGEYAVPEAEAPVPALGKTEHTGGFSLVPLEDLLTMKLTAFRDKDRMHLRDLVSVGLVDENWIGRFPPHLSARLKAILDDPDG
jgi:hypothetical protein